MAQLSDDCFAGSGALMPLDAALAQLTRRLSAVTALQTAALPDALGRFLAEDIVAATDVPPADNAAVDGYAVRFADLDPAAPTALAVIGRAAAGHPFTGTVAAGQAVRIFTGAPMPAGADTVLMQEDCTLDHDRVTISPGIAKGANSRDRGEDVRAGDTILAAGRRLAAADIGLAASVGVSRLPVHCPLRVAVFSTGDEVTEPGAARPPGAIYDANRHALRALLDGFGCATADLGILPDDAAAIAAALADAAPRHDAVITSGGMSQGEEDHVAGVVTDLGRLHFWRLAIKPGRPVAMGQIGGTAFFGLPGNPAAMMVTFFMIVRPALRALAGGTPAAPLRFPVAAGFAHRKKAGRREFLRAALDGATARKYPHAGAGILRSLVDSQGLVELPEDVTDISPGTTVAFIPFTELWR